MKTVETKTNLSKLEDQVSLGESFVLAKAIASSNAPKGGKRRYGFLSNTPSVPKDFDRLNEREIIRLFEGGE